MNNIDLIPQQYHRKRLFDRWLKRALLVFLLCTAVIVSAFALLRFETADMQQKIKQLQAQKAISNNKRAQLEKLDQRKKDFQQRLNLLAGLRSGAPAETMFSMVNQSMPAQRIWINRWRFRRAGTAVEKPDNTVNTGYFIVIPQGAGTRNQKQETWKIETRMTLDGQAFDYEALSDFVLNLTRRSEIESVRVLTTQMIEVSNIKLVNFSVEVTVAPVLEKQG